MFHRIFGNDDKAATEQAQAAPPASVDTTAGDTATVRRIVARLEAMPHDQARLAAAAAYTIARAANADLDISPEETEVIEKQLQEHDLLYEPTAVLVTEMAKLQARTVAGTEDFVVTREFKAVSTHEQRLDILRACFAVSAANGSISAEETATVNEIAAELDIDQATLNAIRADYHEQLSSVQQIRRVTQGS